MVTKTKTTTTKSVKMIHEIIKNAKYVAPAQKQFHGIWVDNGYQYCTDTHRIVMLYKPVNIEIEQVKQTDKIICFVNDKFLNAETECTETIELPPVTEIREQIKELIGRKYKSNKLLYRLGEDPELAVVNAKYLVECMELIGATELKYNPNKPKNGVSYMETELGKVLLMPIYNTDNKVGYWKIGL